VNRRGFRTQITIVSSLTRSGTSRGQSDSVVNSIRLALEDYKWSINGTAIVYEDLDDGTEAHGSWVPEREIANARYASSNPNVLAYIGTLDADAAAYSLPILNRAGPLLMISPCNSYSGFTRTSTIRPHEPGIYYPTGVRHYARTALTDDLQATAGARWVAEAKIKRVFVVHDGEPYGRGLVEPFVAACHQLRIEVAGEPKAITPRAASYFDLVDEVRRSDAELLYYGGIIQNGAGQLCKDLRAALPRVNFMGADALFEQAFLAGAGEAANGAYITFGGIPPAQLTGNGAVFYRRYKKAFRTEPEPYAASAYDATGAVLNAIARVGHAERAAITRETLATHDYDGALGRWSFDAWGDINLRSIARIQVVGGAFRYLGVCSV
jgi:branched-chain amino acid transport system substrate-binding protein